MAMPRKARPEPASKEDVNTAVALVRKDLNTAVALVREDLSNEVALVRQDLGAAVASVRKDLNKAVASARAEAKQDFMKLAVELEKRPTRTEMREGFDAVNGRLDRMMGILDRTSGENLDIRRTLTVFDAMFGESRRTLQSHDRRLSALETRLPPTP